MKDMVGVDEGSDGQSERPSINDIYYRIHDWFESNNSELWEEK